MSQTRQDLPAHVVFAEQRRIIFLHILVNECDNRLPKPTRLVRYLVALKITIHNPLLLRTEQTNHTFLALRFLKDGFLMCFFFFSHILCKFSFTSAISKKKMRKFVVERYIFRILTENGMSHEAEKVWQNITDWVNGAKRPPLHTWKTKDM